MFFRKLGKAYQSAAVIIFNTALLLLVLEYLAGRIYEAKVVETETRMNLSYYQNVDWGARYWDEFASIRESDQSYYPYVIWRRNPFAGELINIDESRLRVTPGADCDQADAYRVFVFGGSTIWGTGAPDWGTIPAYLQESLAQTLERPVCVINFGETAYISTQSLIMLMLQLQRDHVPDLVIFYDGVNEVGSGYANQQPTLHNSLTNIEIRFQERTKTERLRETNTYKVLANFFNSPVLEASRRTAPYVLGMDTDDLSQAVAQTYFNNYRLVEALAATYGFDFYFFWQPVMLVGNKALTAEEAQAGNKDVQPGLIELYQQTYPIIDRTAAEYDHMHYLADVFDHETDIIWIDFAHITPEGNRLVADAMLQHLPLNQQAS